MRAPHDTLETHFVPMDVLGAHVEERLVTNQRALCDWALAFRDEHTVEGDGHAEFS